MALLAEQIVEEWLNRKGFFTVRGARKGVNEIDLLGVRPSKTSLGKLEAWHVEVQVSFRPNAYISKLNENQMEQLDVKGKNSAKKRPLDLLRRTVESWVDGKFRSKLKQEMRESRWKGLDWQFKLVHAVAKHPGELEFIADQGIELIKLQEILQELEETELELKGHSGTDILEIISYYNAGKMAQQKQ